MARTVYFYIDGVVAGSQQLTASQSDYDGFMTFANHYAPGKHTLQMRTEAVMDDGTTFSSELLYYEFVVTGTDQTLILMEARLPNTTPPVPANQTPILSGTQYVRKEISWAYYSSQPGSATVTWRLVANGTESALASRIADMSDVNYGTRPDPLVFMPTEYSNPDPFEIQAVIGGVLVQSYNIDVERNESLFENTDGLLMKLSGLGRSNNEPDETLRTWTDRGYSCTFSDMPFNANAGYVDDAVVFNAGATGIIDIKPYAVERAVAAQYGNTVELDFMSFNVDDDDAVILRIGNPSEGASLTVYPTKAVLRSNDGASVTARFKADERVKLAFVTYPKDGTLTLFPQFMMVQNNGVLAPASKYSLADHFNIGSTTDTGSTDGMIHIGDAAGKAGIKVYFIRVYGRPISSGDELSNYIIDSGSNIESLVTRNDIFAQGSDLDLAKIASLVPLVKLTGDVQLLIDAQDKQRADVAMEITFPEEPELNMSCDKAEIRTAGQSTLGMKMAPSMHVKLDKNGNKAFDANGNPLLKNRWAFRAGNVPEKKFRLQANPMESSGCHNGAFLRMVNATYPNVEINGQHVLRIPAQEFVLGGGYARGMAAEHGGNADDYEFPYRINFVPDSRPCVVVWRPDDGSTYQMLGLYVIMEEKKADFASGKHSIYDKIAPDGTLDPFDFKEGEKGNRLWDNEGCRQIENVRETDYSLFRSLTGWDTASARQTFELIYPDPDDVEADPDDDEWNYWDEFGSEMLQPIIDTYGDQAAFDAIIFDIIDIWHTAAYYSRVLRNTCSDSLVRNLEWTRYATDGKWIPKWWDVDMQLGLQQSGHCDAEPKTDRQTPQPSNQNAYVLTGHESWLWNALENNEEFMAAVRAVDQALYDKGWNYQGMTSLQDDGYVKQWSESLYNLDGTVKYIGKTMDGTGEALGVDYLVNFQGDRTSHRHWFERTSYDYWDARWAVGAFKSHVVYVRASGAPQGSKMHFIAGETTYYGYGLTQDSIESSQRHAKGEEFWFELDRNITGQDPIYIYAANKLECIDLHEIMRYPWGDPDFAACFDPVTGTLLKTLIIGITKEDMGNGIFNDNELAFKGLGYLTRVETLNVQGLRGTAIIDLSGMANLHTLRAAGSGMTAFAPAEGAVLAEVELPVTVRSITAARVTLPATDGGVKWFDGATQTTCPDSLRYLSLTGMGSDSGTHMLLHQWLTMLRDNPDKIEAAELHCRNLDWRDISVDDLLTLAQIPAGQRSDVTGYVKCTTEYTTAQMAALIAAFGENVFSMSNIRNGLVCDCQSNSVMVSASGAEVTVQDGVIEVPQGSAIHLYGVGFPILDNSTYKWYVKINGVYSHGDPVEFGNGHCSLHEDTGVLATEESADAATVYDILVVRSDAEGGTGQGTAQVRIVPRTYPTDVELVLASGADVVDVNDELQLTATGHYLFEAIHKRMEGGEEVPYTGHMAATDGGVWTLQCADQQITLDEYATSCANHYTDGKTAFEQFCLRVVQMAEGLPITLSYTSHWRNGTTLTASRSIVLDAIVQDVLVNNDAFGNVALFDAIHKATCVEPVILGSYNSAELKLVTYIDQAHPLKFDEIPDYDETALVSFTSNNRNVLAFLKNLWHLDLGGCTNLASFDPSVMTWLKSLGMRNCAALREVQLPTSVTLLYQGAFEGTSEMLEIRFTGNTVLSLGSTGLAASKGSLFVNDNKVASYTGYEEVVEPVSDWGETALMWPDGTRVRFADGSTALLY